MMKDRPVRSSATIRSEEVQDNYSTKVAGGTIRMHKKCRLLAVSKLRTQKQRSLEVTTSAAVASCCISESITGVWTSAAFTERCHWQPPGTWTATRTSRNNSHSVTPSDYVEVTTSAAVDSSLK